MLVGIFRGWIVAVLFSGTNVDILFSNVANTEKIDVDLPRTKKKTRLGGETCSAKIKDPLRVSGNNHAPVNLGTTIFTQCRIGP